ncbi:MAG: rhomboid family intramembrane serine protease [Halioglobus sp.]
MTEFHQAISVPVEEDLLPLSVLLHQHAVVHRVFEEGGRQVVTVQREEQVQKVQSLYKAWRAGDVKIELSKAPSTATPRGARLQWRSSPVTLLLVVLSICGFALVSLPSAMPLVSLLTFTPFKASSGQLLFESMNHEYWRLVTPAFLHFSWLHIAFNCLWLWDLGARAERVIGHFNMFMLFLVIAIVSNSSQFVFGGSGLFGGMSGVVYGLLGFSWVAPLLQPAWDIRPSTPIMLLMVGWLVACILGMVEVLGFGAVANAAHVGGLICGAVLGALVGGLSRISSDKR